MGFLDKFKKKEEVAIEEMSIEDLFVKTKKRDGDACFEVGRRYFEGEGVDCNYEKAVEFFERAVHYNSNAEALYSLAICHEKGYGVTHNAKAAYHYYKKLHEQGLFQGTYDLGRLTLLGFGCESDPKKAIELFKIAANNEIPEAYYYIGVCLNDGIGLNQNYQKAYNFFKKAASMGCEEANKMVRVYQENGFE